MKIGAQFYTIRDFCTTTAALDESMKKVADIGYKHIQLSGVCAYEADWMAERLKAYGLEANITHFSYDKIVGETDATIAFHDTMGCKYIGVGGNPRGVTPEGLATMAAEIKPALAKIVAGGHKFMYHNHHMEFARFDGKTFLDLLCETFTPEECGVTLDTYWAQAGGADPAQWLRRLDGRVNCVHFKDMVFSQADGAVRMAAIGDGNMNYPEILKACEDAHVEYGFVEQDNCYDMDPFVALKRSYDYLRAQGLE
jgi:sugar phosphate isomerase/epimerase